MQLFPQHQSNLTKSDCHFVSGGSGLVFYTDAYFWKELEGKDFDEDTVDDWDVDYSVYYEDGEFSFQFKNLEICLK